MLDRKKLVREYADKYMEYRDIEDLDGDLSELALLEEMDSLGIEEEVFDLIDYLMEAEEFFKEY
jgi:hypothetical protein